MQAHLASLQSISIVLAGSMLRTLCRCGKQVFSSSSGNRISSSGTTAAATLVHSSALFEAVQQRRQLRTNARAKFRQAGLPQEPEIIRYIKQKTPPGVNPFEEGFLPEDDFSDDEGDGGGRGRLREPQIDAQGRSYGLGRRKSAVARVWIQPGDGTFLVNRSPLHERFPRDGHQNDILDPMYVTGAMARFDVSAMVQGGGASGQAGAVQLGLARALDNYQPSLRKTLRAAGFMTRDPRMVERKKPGQPKARKKKQWVKR